MIKILAATHRTGTLIELEFSDGSVGDFDLGPTLAKDSTLTRPLRDPEQFKRFSIDFGALCWPNGFELSPTAIHRRLADAGALRRKVA